MTENKILQLDDTEYIKTIEFRKGTEINDITLILDDFILQIDELKIENDEQFGTSNDLLKKIKKMNPKIEKYRKELTDPMRLKVNSINDDFNKVKKIALTARETLEDKIKAYSKIKADADRIRANEKKLKELDDLKKQKAIEKASFSFLSDEPDPSTQKVVESIDNSIKRKENEPIKVQRTFKTENSTTTFTENWKFKIIDIDAINKMYWSPDRTKIQNAIDMGIRDIPGTEIYNDEIVSSR